jgi:protein-S-isoprenylcysteine O-methyltransferase Ste14
LAADWDDRVSAGEFFARWRVRLGYPLSLVALAFARPNPRSIRLGALLGLIGLLIRALAAGYLRKQEVLATTGPYAYTRNPLYLGSAILTLGAAVAAWSWVSAVLLCGYFALFYSMVMQGEERELRLQHGPAYDAYARAVPLFFPSLTHAKIDGARSGSFSFAQYKTNREYRAAFGFLVLPGSFFLIWRLRQS